MCVKPEFMDGHLCYKLRNLLGGYGGIRVVRVSALWLSQQLFTAGGRS